MSNELREEKKKMMNEILNILFYKHNFFSLVNVSTKMNIENSESNW